MRSILYWYLHIFGFTITTLLITWGLFVLFFLVIGGFSFDGMMHHLDNLASRYVSADPARLASFRNIILVAHLILAPTVMFFRRHALLPQLNSDGGKQHG